MDNIFKKLEQYGEQGSYHPDHWKAFESTLPKKRRKPLFWLWVLVAPMILGIIFLLNIDRSDGQVLSVKEPITSKSKPFKVDQKQTIKHNQLHQKQQNTTKKTLSVDFDDTDTESNLPKASFPSVSTVASVSIPSSKVLNTNNVVRLAANNPYLSINQPAVFVDNKFSEQHRKMVQRANRIPYLRFPEPLSIPLNLNIPMPGYRAEDTKIIPLQREPIFTVYAGVGGAMMNELNHLETGLLAFGTDIFARLNYSRGGLLGMSFQAGLHNEYNHALEYSYISEKHIFLDKSEKQVSIALKEVSFANLRLSGQLNWLPKLSTNLGVYYNHVLQSRSQISLVGTGKFSELQNQDSRQKSYHGLLNTFDSGIFLSQNFAITPSIQISVDFLAGLNNRLNPAYFADNNIIKRREISFSILKRIK